MNCDDFQRELLNTENPAAPAEEFEDHLATCASCREYQGRLVNIEHNVSHLPVPTSNAQEQFIQTLLQTEPTQSDPFIAVLPLPTRPRLSLRSQILLFLGGLAILGGLVFAGVLLGNWLASVLK